MSSNIPDHLCQAVSIVYLRDMWDSSQTSSWPAPIPPTDNGWVTQQSQHTDLRIIAHTPSASLTSEEWVHLVYRLGKQQPHLEGWRMMPTLFTYWFNLGKLTGVQSSAVQGSSGSQVLHKPAPGALSAQSRYCQQSPCSKPTDTQAVKGTCPILLPWSKFQSHSISV